MNILDKDVFVDNMLKKVKWLNDVDLSDFFSRLNGETEQIFSSIYNSVFINKVSDINNSVLNGLLSVFLSSDEDLVNAWIVDQIVDEIPESRKIVDNLQKMNLENNNWMDVKIEFDQNYLDCASFSIIRNSEKTLFELFTTNEGIEELAKKDVLSSLSDKLTNKELWSLDLLIKKLKVLDYDINDKNIEVEVNNTIERFIYGNLRNQIKPLKLSNKPNGIINDLIIKLNDFIVQEYPAKGWGFLLEIVDIDLDNKIIYVKWNEWIIQDTIQKNWIIENIKSENEALFEEQLLSIQDMNIETTDIEYLDILQQNFIQFLRESKIGTQYYTTATVKDFSFLQKSLLLSVPNEQSYFTFDKQLADSELAKSKKNLYFPAIKFFYCVDSKNKGNTETKKEKSLNSKSKVINSSVFLPIDKTKNLDTFYSLESRKKEYIIEVIESGKNMAILWNRGLWKTHLLQALANYFTAENMSVLYTTWDKFCSEYRSLWKKAKNKDKGDFYKEINSFLDGFDWVDILFLDWIDTLGGRGKTNTQDILKRIILKYPKMKVVFSSKTAFKDIPWMRKKITMDKTVYSEPSTIFDEIFNLNLVVLPELWSDKLFQIAQDQWKDFLNKKNNLFLPKELPRWILHLLAKKINPSLYNQIFESIALNLPEDYSIENISYIIQNFVSEKINPEPNEIIDIVIDSIFNKWNSLFEIMWLSWVGVDIDLWDKNELKSRLQWPIKAESFEWLVVRLCVFYVKQKYPKKSFTDISKYFNWRTNCGTLYNEARDWIFTCKEIDVIIEKEIREYKFNNYWIKE